MSIFGSMPANFQSPSLLKLSKLNFKISPTQQKAITKAAFTMPKAQAKALQKSITKGAMSLLGDTPAQRKIAAEQLQTGGAITPSMVESMTSAQKAKLGEAIISAPTRAAERGAISSGIDTRVVEAKKKEVSEKYGGLQASLKQREAATKELEEFYKQQRQTESALAPIREQSKAAAQAAAKRIRRTSLVRFTPMSLTRQKGKGAVALDEDNKSFFGSYL